MGQQLPRLSIACGGFYPATQLHKAVISNTSSRAINSSCVPAVSLLLAQPPMFEQT
jgi:hypothetical protein